MTRRGFLILCTCATFYAAFMAVTQVVGHFHPAWGRGTWAAIGLFFGLCGTALLVVIHLTRPKPAVAGTCPVCGYDMRSTPDRCPECGTPAPPGFHERAGPG